MEPRLNTCERWIANRPCSHADRSTAWKQVGSILLNAGLIVLTLLLLAAFAAQAHAQSETQDAPAVYVFTAPGCAPCAALKEMISNGQVGEHRFFEVRGDSETYREFLRTVPGRDVEIDPAYIGRLSYRSTRTQLVPAVWVRGRTHYWSGYTAETLPELQRYLAQTVQPAVVPRRPPAPQPQRLNPGTVVDLELEGDESGFDGVQIVVAVAHLTDRFPELRAEVARRADRVLQDLASTHIGEKVRATFVAEVADAERYQALCHAVGMQPAPAACFVLVPQRFSGLKGLLVKRAHTALAEHFVLPLQQAGVHVVLERLHGPTYDAVLDVVLERQPPESPGPGEGLQFLAAAWLSERSNVMRRLLARFGFATA